MSVYIYILSIAILVFISSTIQDLCFINCNRTLTLKARYFPSMLLNVCGSITTFEFWTERGTLLVLSYTTETSCPVVFFRVLFQVLLPKLGSLYILGVCGHSPVKSTGLLYFKPRRPQAWVRLSVRGSALTQVNIDMTSCDSCPNYKALIRWLSPKVRQTFICARIHWFCPAVHHTWTNILKLPSHDRVAAQPHSLYILLYLDHTRIYTHPIPAVMAGEVKVLFSERFWMDVHQFFSAPWLHSQKAMGGHVIRIQSTKHEATHNLLDLKYHIQPGAPVCKPQRRAAHGRHSSSLGSLLAFCI